MFVNIYCKYALGRNAVLPQRRWQPDSGFINATEGPLGPSPSITYLEFNMNEKNLKQPRSFHDVALSCAINVVLCGVLAGLVMSAAVAIFTALWFGVPIAAEHLYRFVTGGGVAPWRNVLLTFALAALYSWCVCVTSKFPDEATIVVTMWSVYVIAMVVHGVCVYGFLTTLQYAYESVYTKNVMPLVMEPYEYVALICCAILSVLVLIVAMLNAVFEMEATDQRLA